MRIKRFTIFKYGAIGELDLNFGDGCGLHVIHGPNEAGKSTCLSAISDFLFGIGHGSPYGAVFGNDQIRLDARLMLSDGQELDLRRRKGRTRTLSTFDGQTVGDDRLAAVLGGMTRERFAALFGLNDETLRTGGMDLLRANGDIGRLIVEAGGGLRALMVRLDEIDARRTRLFAARRSADREFYQALDAFGAAQKTLRDASLGHDAYERHCRSLEEARQKKADISTRQTELRRQHTHYERLVKAVPQLHDITLLETELAGQADLATLPAGMGASIAAALETYNATRTRHARAVEHATELRHKTAVPQVDTILAALHGPVMRAISLGQAVSTHRGPEAEHDSRRRSIDESLSSLRRRLNAGPDADLRQCMPPRAVLDTIRQLADAQAQWQGQHDSVQQKIGQTELEIARRQERLSTLHAAGRDLPLPEDAAPFTALPAEMKRLDLRAQALEKQQADLDARLGAMGFSSIDLLRHLPCPGADGVRMAAEHQHMLRTERDRLASKLAGEREHLTTLQPQLTQLEQTGSPATPEMLATARTQRDAMWHLVRAAYLDPQHVVADAVRQVNAAALDHAISRVDALSAQLLAEASRIAEIENLRRRIADCTDRVALYDRSHKDADERIAAHWQGFIAPFPALHTHAVTPEALATFIRQRTEILTGAEQITREREILAHERIKPDTQQDHLERLAKRFGIDPGTSLAACVESVTAAMRLHVAEHDEYNRLKRECDELRPVLAQQAQQAESLRMERQAWQEKWATAMQVIGLPADAAPVTARDLAGEWAAAPAYIEQLAELDDARAHARQALTELTQVMDDLRPRIPLALPSDSVDAALALSDHWKAAEKARVQREALHAEMKRAAQAVTESETTLSAAMADIQALQVRTHTEAPEGLQLLAERLTRRDQVHQKLEHALHTLSRMTDGQSPADLKQAIDGRTLSELLAETARIEDQLKEQEQLRDDAVRAEQHEITALGAFEHNTEAPQAAARREAAISRLHRIVEEYAELTLARTLIANAIDRVRAQEQDPLVTRAGQFMSLATRGAFEGIRTELDTTNEPVVQGLRHDGSIVPVKKMSAGTRDQLFLAFRLASVETYCRSAEPLPFIADDLLVQFDDARSRSTLSALVDFARTTQVLLFTHHDSIRNMTRRLHEQGAPVNLVELPPVYATRPMVENGAV
ncbi:hypothetical protein CFR79_09430 [Komagataeibacter saccharivorans]|uniref:YhaN family protein n=1 Tax=Komagataeibacter saccharivorans TaxID=265959 RepID=UPI000D7C96B0|nr:YhaN family protein [Komagataeibacter saccharivorans]PYD50422.1 hypothetical protein CFR79_09430 [Komagataeibacter saccharivorans]GBQ41179.1 hypothetical protein AA0614_2235 [Komagataeibacter saccharivorans NRIC 0614]